MSKPVLHYFDARARAELTRLCFAAAGADFEDHRIDYFDGSWNDEEKTKSPLGQLPYLEIGELKLPQSTAIARYIAKEHNLYGSNSLEQAESDAIVDTISDIVNSYYHKVFIAEDKAAAWPLFRDNDAAQGMKSLEKLISSYGANGFSVGSALTWADLYVYHVTSTLFDNEQAFLDAYPLLKQVRASVEANERVSQYLKSRKPTLF